MEKFRESLPPCQCRRYSGKVAVITGSTSSIGYSIAERLAAEGAQIVISSRQQSNVDEAVDLLRSKGYEVLGVACDAGSKEDIHHLITQTVEKYGGIDVVVANAAAIEEARRPLETTEDQFDRTMNVNLKGPFELAKEAVPYMEKRGGGSIVFIGSVSGFSPGTYPAMAAYGVMKTALMGLTKALVPQLSRYNIRVNCVAPGPVKSDGSRKYWSNETVHKRAIQPMPMKRFGLPHEVGAAVAFVASDDASYITGETILVSGGFLSRL